LQRMRRTHLPGEEARSVGEPSHTGCGVTITQGGPPSGDRNETYEPRSATPQPRQPPSADGHPVPPRRVLRDPRIRRPTSPMMKAGMKAPLSGEMHNLRNCPSGASV
jgi:hypothetical protein